MAVDSVSFCVPVTVSVQAKTLLLAFVSMISTLVMAEPLLAAVVQPTASWPFWPFAAAVTPVGALGFVRGVADLAALVVVPATLVTRTLYVYAVPLVRPVSVYVGFWPCVFIAVVREEPK